MTLIVQVAPYAIGALFIAGAVIFAFMALQFNKVESEETEILEDEAKNEHQP